MESCGGSSPSYYTILGVSEGSSNEELRRAYRKLAMQWHPDKWTKNPSLLGEAKRRFQQIQEAYSVLSDPRRRTLYDAGLYDSREDDGEVEGFADFVQEMVSLMKDVRREGKTYSMEELQTMFWDMAKGFEVPEWPNLSQQPPVHLQSSSQWFSGAMTFNEGSATSKGASMDSSMAERSPFLDFSYLQMHGVNPFCR
nr:chaperone protein DnaJ-like [Ipomoea batatas]